VTHPYLVFSGIGHIVAWVFNAAVAGGLIGLFAMLIRDAGHHFHYQHHHHQHRHA